MILVIFSLIAVNSQSNNYEIPNAPDSTTVTGFKVESSDSGVTVLMYLESSKSLSDKKAQEQSNKDNECSLLDKIITQ